MRILFLVFFSPVLFSQTFISGYVTDPQNNPLPGVAVKLNLLNGGALLSYSITDTNGFFKTVS